MKWRGQVDGYRFTLHDEGSFFYTNDAEDSGFLPMTHEAAEAMWKWLESLNDEPVKP